MTAQPPEAGRELGIRPYLRQPPPAPSAGQDQDGANELRPFVLTSGRVQAADPEIGLETQVTARTPDPPAPPRGLTPELRAIVALCAEPMSVAEISARLRLHLGVTRILVGDLRTAGHLDVHTADVADPCDPETIMRVIRGLRALS